MSIEQDIFSAVKSELENSTTLKNYVQKVYDGLRGFDDSFVPQDIKNYIVIEPLSAEETYPVGSDTRPDEIGIAKQVTFVIAIVGVITASADDQFSFVTGNNQIRGILDLDEDIKNVVDKSDVIHALSDAQNVNITTQSFIFETFPKRKVIQALTIVRNFRKGER